MNKAPAITERLVLKALRRREKGQKEPGRSYSSLLGVFPDHTKLSHMLNSMILRGQIKTTTRNIPCGAGLNDQRIFYEIIKQDFNWGMPEEFC